MGGTAKEYGVDTVLTTVGSSVHIFGDVKVLAAPAEIQAGKRDDTFDRLSDPATADLGGPDTQMSPRYALSKLMLHALLHEFAARVPPSSSNETTKERVIINWVNPGWCASDIGRDKAALPFMNRVFFAILGRTTECGSRTLVHAGLSGEESHGKFLSECRVTPEMVWLQSSEGREVGARLWSELMRRVWEISPEVAGFVR